MTPLYFYHLRHYYTHSLRILLSHFLLFLSSLVFANFAIATQIDNNNLLAASIPPAPSHPYPPDGTTHISPDTHLRWGKTEGFTIENNINGEHTPVERSALSEPAEIEILAFIAFSDNDNGNEYEHTLEVLAEYITDFHVTPTTSYTSASLAIELYDKDVFLIPEQENWYTSAMGEFGEDTAPVLRSFMENGGIVIVCDHRPYGGGAAFVSATESFHPIFAENFSDRAAQVTVSHPITRGVPDTFTAMNGCVNYETISDAEVLVLDQESQKPIVAVKEIGKGGIALIGWDYYTYNTTMARLIANAVQWGGGSDPVTYDVYFDTTEPPTTIIASDVSSRVYDPGPLDLETTYWWKVIASNPTGASPGPVWSFTTIGPPGEIEITDSIPPKNDLEMPFNVTIIDTASTETLTIHNTDPNHDVIITNISFGAYSENFHDGKAQGWIEIPDEQWQVVSGEYRAQSGELKAPMQSLYLPEEWENCYTQVTMHRTGNMNSTARLIVRASDDFNYPVSTGFAYLVAISGNANYYVGKYLDGNFSFIQSWTYSPYLNTGSADNVVGFNIHGPSIDIYFNSALAWSGTDTHITGKGLIGLTAYSGSGTEAIHYFDNVSVNKSLQSSEVLSASQQWYNLHAFGSSDPNTDPNTERKVVYPGKNEETLSGNLTIVPELRSSFSLHGLPEMPYILPGGDRLAIDVAYKPESVEAHSDVLTIESNDSDEPSVDVQLSGIGIKDYLEVTPETAFLSTGHPGGPFNPDSKSYLLSNTGSFPIDWIAKCPHEWVESLPENGSLGTGTSKEVALRLTPAAAALEEGVYTSTVIFNNLTMGRHETRDVTLTVFTSPEIILTPDSLRATLLPGQSLHQTLTIGNSTSGDENLEFILTTRGGYSQPITINIRRDKMFPSEYDFTHVDPNASFVSNQLLVRFDSTLHTNAQRASLLNVVRGAEIEHEFSLVPGLCVVNVPHMMSIEETLASFNSTSGILYAEPNYIVTAYETIPNDPLFSDLWGMHNTGQTGGTTDADIDAPEAWDSSTGSHAIIVAVIDTGIDYDHNDLQANMWKNSEEIPNNDIDDDGNGYVDDVYGYDFYNSDPDPMDDHYHGTHCAGTIGAVGNNGIGVSGVCWNVRLMALKFLGSNASGEIDDAIKCIEYAIQMGAHVMSNSWGNYYYNQALKDAIDAAGAAHIPFIAAAGNDRGNNDSRSHYPASFTSSNIISVMATNYHDQKSSFSNYGLTSVDIGAPGSDILSCAPGGQYKILSGTSMAAPHVAGACALLLSADPALDVHNFKHILFSTVDLTLPGLCVSEGRLNLARAMGEAGSSWLTLTPESASGIAPGSSVDIDVEYNPGTLNSGTYDGQITISSNDLLEPMITVPVSMTILPEGLIVEPEDIFKSRGPLVGPFSPTEIHYSVTNTASVQIDWTVTHSENWLDVSASEGTLEPGNSTVVTVSLNSQSQTLSLGTHSDVLIFTNKTTGLRQMRRVELTVEKAASRTLFYEDFEDAQPLAPYWEVNGTGTYRTQVTSDFSPHTGSYHLTMDSMVDTPDHSRNELTLTIDISKYDHIMLSFFSKEFGDEAHGPPLLPYSYGADFDGVAISEDGTLWYEAKGLRSLTDEYEKITVDLDNALAQYGLSYTPFFKIRFNHYDNLSIVRDGIALDDIMITGTDIDGLVVVPRTGFSISGYKGGPFSPFCTTYTLVNNFSSSLNWTAYSSTDWIDVTPDNGALSSGSSTSVEIFINSHAQSLQSGQYTGKVTFTNTISQVSQIREVSLTVLELPPLPPEPHTPFPEDSATSIPADIDLIWNRIILSSTSSDRDQMPLSITRSGTLFAPSTYYDVFFDTVHPPTMKIADDITETQCYPGLLDVNTTYWWQVVASNITGSTTGLVWSFTTLALPAQPIIAPINEDTGYENIPFTGPIPSLLQGSRPIMWSLQEGPAGMTINPYSGVVSWTSPTLSSAPYPITIRVENDLGHDDETWLLSVHWKDEFEFGHLWSWWAADSEILTPAVGSYEQMPDTSDWALALTSLDTVAHSGAFPALAYGYWLSPRATAAERISYFPDTLYRVRWSLVADHGEPSTQPGLRFRIMCGSDSCGGDMILQEFGGSKIGISPDPNSPSEIDHYWYPPQWLVNENIALYPEQTGLFIAAEMFDNRAAATGTYWIPRVEVCAFEPPPATSPVFSAPPFDRTEWRDNTKIGEIVSSIHTTEGLTIDFPSTPTASMRVGYWECVNPVEPITIQGNSLYRATYTVTSTGQTPPVFRQRMLVRHLYIGSETIFTPTIPWGNVFEYAKPGAIPREIVCYLPIKDQYLPWDDLLFSMDVYGPVLSTDLYYGSYTVSDVKIEVLEPPQVE